MAVERIIIPGIVKNGLVVPQSKAPLPEGAQVEIMLPTPEVPAELQGEFEAWEQLSDEAWSHIDKWEQDDKS